jgi:hypothetical protein
MEIPWTIPKTDGKIRKLTVSLPQENQLIVVPFEEALHVVENSLIPQLLVPVVCTLTLT